MRVFAVFFSEYSELSVEKKPRVSAGKRECGFENINIKINIIKGQ